MPTAKKLKINSDFLRMLVILVVFIILATVTSGSNFMSVVSFQTMAKQLTEYGLMSIALAMAMITGGIDLSTVYIANMCGAIASLTMSAIAPEGQAFGILVACVLALVIGLCCGALNGILVSVVGVPPMLATLGTYELFSGITIVLSNGQSIQVIPQFTVFATLDILGIPLPFIVFVVMAIIFSILLGKTAFGRRVHLVGVNSKASRFAGINNEKTVTMAYTLGGLLCAIAGLISLSRVSSVKADFGSSYVMMTILIAVLGGCNPAGGWGEIPGVATAVLVLQVISQWLTAIPWINGYYRQALYGVLLLGFMTYKFYRDKNKGRR